MAKKATLTDVSSGYSSNQTLNDNFNALNNQFDNTLSRDGSTPNAMNADIDLNGNDVANVKDLTVSGTIVLAGTDLGAAFTNADADAQAAAASASAAASSASAAGISETSAGDSATAAAASEASAQAILDDFETKYLGAKASDPSVDNVGNPLVEGATYWDSVNDTLKFYDGVNWVSETGIDTSDIGPLAGVDSISGLAVTQSNLDTTAGRLTKVGDFGLGTSTLPVITDIDSFDHVTGFYTVNSTTAAGTFPPNVTSADMVQVLRPAGNQRSQILLTPNASGSGWIRRSTANTGWSSWQPLQTKRYDSIFDLRDAVTSGELGTGEVAECHGHQYVQDSTATGIESALYLFGVNGLRSVAHTPNNLFLFPGFKTQDITTQQLFISPDGRRFSRLNNLPMLRGGGDSNVGGRDCQLFWCREAGEWFMPVTAGDAQPYDFSIYRSPDLVSWRLVNCYLGADGVRGEILGGGVPADKIWSPRLVYDSNGDLYITISIRSAPDYTDGFGGNSIALRPWAALCTSIDNLTFAEPTAMNFASGAKLDPDFIYEGGTWYAAIKNSVNRNIEIHSSSTLLGAYTIQKTLDIDGTLDSLEGPTWALTRYYDAGTNAMKLKHRVHCANNRDANDDLKGVARYFESTTGPIGTYTGPTQLDFAFATRNGTTTNVALEPDPRAMETLKSAITAYSGTDRTRVDAVELLPSGNSDLYPQQDFMYYIEGVSEVANLTIKEKVADRFWLGCLSIYEGTGINLFGNNLVRAEHIGFGAPPMQVLEMRWNEHLGQYIAHGERSKRRFRATMSANQSVTSAGSKLNFNVESYDIGTAYDTGAYFWRPGRGLLRVKVQITTTSTAVGVHSLKLVKNGTTIIGQARGYCTNGGDIMTIFTEVTDYPNSTDFYTVEYLPPATTTVSSGGVATWFEGEQL